MESFVIIVNGWKPLDVLNPIQDGPFRGCSRMGGMRGLPKICYENSKTMKLATVIPYLEKMQNICESPDTSLEFCCHQHFSQEISNYIKKHKYRLNFGT